MALSDLPEHVRERALALAREVIGDREQVYVVHFENRLYVGVEPATTVRGSDIEPVNVTVSKDEIR